VHFSRAANLRILNPQVPGLNPGDAPGQRPFFDPVLTPGTAFGLQVCFPFMRGTKTQVAFRGYAPHYRSMMIGGSGQLIHTLGALFHSHVYPLDFMKHDRPRSSRNGSGSCHTSLKPNRFRPAYTRE